jgi:hypothetical protein
VRHALRTFVVALAGLVVGGCTGIELGAVGVAALSAGAGSVVKTGTEYTLTGIAYRTFSLPLDDLAAVLRSTLARMEFRVNEAAVVNGDLVVVAGGIDCAVHLRLTAITPAVTRLRVSVRKGLINLDRATTSEIVTQLERSIGYLNSPVDLR